jgi:hypothetical protein
VQTPAVCGRRTVRNTGGGGRVHLIPTALKCPIRPTVAHRDATPLLGTRTALRGPLGHCCMRITGERALGCGAGGPSLAQHQHNSRARIHQPPSQRGLPQSMVGSFPTSVAARWVPSSLPGRTVYLLGLGWWSVLAADICGPCHCTRRALCPREVFITWYICWMIFWSSRRPIAMCGDHAPPSLLPFAAGNTSSISHVAAGSLHGMVIFLS